MKRRFLAVHFVRALALAVFSLSTPSPGAPVARDPSKLDLLGSDYPRAFFFRSSEGAARRAADYDAWDAEYSRLMGIMGKCLDEEIVGHTARNPEFFNRFKERHPSQAVLLHFNGNARDPRFETGRYFPGHWVYRKAVTIAADVPAESGETDIRVQDASDFKVNTGRYRESSDDIALFGIAADDRHDWTRCEQVQLVSVDAAANTIRVRRGAYGTTPLAFKAGAARAAAHAAEGPWGRTNHLLWFYNYSTDCPRDPEGRTCADRLIDDLARWFSPDGVLARFDGLEFDVLFHETRGDTDGDGVEDNGVIGGVNRYGIGVIDFARRLRERMGDGFILQADGALGPGGVRSQRAFGLFNGIESEGWPNLNDWEFRDWSGGLNRHAFWNVNARAPAFSYINHKWIQPVPGKPGEHANPDVPFSRHRLALAAAQLVDAMVCYSFVPPRSRRGPQPIGIWDELIGGAGGKPGWLGRPLGPPVHLAAREPDLLRDVPWTSRIRGDVDIKDEGRGRTIASRAGDAREIRFTLPDIPVRGSNLVVFVTLRGDALRGCPASMARFAEVGVSGGLVSLTDRDPDQTGMILRGGADRAIERATGAAVAWRPSHGVAGTNLPAVFVHPPYQGARGAVFWCREADVPAGADLRFQLGMSEKAPQRSDGVWFQVWAMPPGNAGPETAKKIFEAVSKEHRWIPHSVSLADWAGRRVRFKFVADCGPRDNATTDQAAWGDVKIVRPGGVTPPQRHMTWVNERDFASSFYFRDIGSKTVDLSFAVEGSGPVTVTSISAHAAPDAVARLFENGLVLANPSRSPYTFDLKNLFPGRAYRRFAATPGQDAATNNGQPVGGNVAIGERDGLFLRADAGSDAGVRPPEKKP